MVTIITRRGMQQSDLAYRGGKDCTGSLFVGKVPMQINGWIQDPAGRNSDAKVAPIGLCNILAVL